ncbi:16523_t:CDS:1, partial [Funneliformis geosporum]
QDVENFITRNTCGRRMKNVITNMVSQQKQQIQKRQQQTVETQQSKVNEK